MEQLPAKYRPLTLTQQINLVFLAPKGYDVFTNIQSHDSAGIYDSYLLPNKNIASGLTQQNCQITFISKFNKNERPR